MHNPYENERDLTDYRVSAGTARVLGVLFLLVLVIPPLADLAVKIARGELAESPFVQIFRFTPSPDQRFREHLWAVERSLDQLPYAKALRRQTQQRLTQWAGEGNRRVHPARNGWLFYRPELQALNGWGPLQTEPAANVMKDPTLAKLRPARERVLEFAAQLKERGIPLLLVPVPVKPMLYHEHLFLKGPDAPLYHPDQLAFYDELRAAGIDVLDLTQPLYEFKKRHPVFLKQDTHWTPEAMKKAAALVADHIKKTWPELANRDTTPLIDARLHDRSGLGDLVGLLDLAQPEALFAPESVQLVSIQGLDPDRAAPITLLGDSFVNIYTDPTLGFGGDAGADAGSGQDTPPMMNAGFAHQLSLSLGRPLDVIARNGAGTTQTRREFAQRPDDEVRAKKLVVWVIACRDLLYSPAAARDANIVWESVTFNPNSSRPAAAPAAVPSEGKVIVEAELIAKSTNQSPDATPYIDALHTALYRVTQVVSGDFDPAANWQAIQWTFKQKQMQPTAGFTPGKRYRLTLIPWDDQTPLHGLNRSSDKTDEDDFLAERWFVEAAEEK